MKIEFERCGGTHNIKLSTTVDTSKLPGDEAKQLEALVSRVQLDSKATAKPGCSANSCGCRRDNFSYTVRVTDDTGKTSTFKFKEGGNRDLVSALTEKAIDAVV